MHRMDSIRRDNRSTAPDIRRILAILREYAQSRGVDITGKGIKQVKSVLPDSWTRVTIKCKDKVYTRK